MCAATTAAIAGTVATVATAGIGVAQATGAMGGGAAGGSGSFTEKQLKGFAPTKGLQSYAARLLAMNATTQRPTLQEYAASGSTARFPIVDPGFTPGEAADLSIVDPHSGLPMPFVNKSQTQLSPAQQVFLGQQRARQGATGPLAQLGMATAKQQRLSAQLPSAGVATSANIAGRLSKLGTRITNINRTLKAGGGAFGPGTGG